MCIDRERRALALRVAINGFFLLLGSRFAGSHVLEFVGITLPVFCALPGGWWSLRSAGRSSRPKGELADQRTAETARGPCERAPLI